MQMATVKKNRRVWAYLDEADEKRLEKVLAVVQPHLEEARALAVILKAGLQAVEEHGYKRILPLKFKVEEGK